MKYIVFKDLNVIAPLELDRLQSMAIYVRYLKQRIAAHIPIIGSHTWDDLQVIPEEDIQFSRDMRDGRLLAEQRDAPTPRLFTLEEMKKAMYHTMNNYKIMPDVFIRNYFLTHFNIKL
jgi:hypothetical protein